MANINKIRVSGTTYDIQDINAPKVIELTQSEYDSLTTKDPNAFYVITDSEYNFDGYWTSAQTQSAITQAVSGKQDTLVSSVNIKTINNESLLGSGNIDIQGGGGGKAIEAGRGISVTTGETADTVSFDLPISAATNGSILIGVSCSANRDKSFVGGQGSVGQGEGSFAFGEHCKASQWSIAVGSRVEANIMPSTAAFGKYNKQNGGYFEPESATTLFSVGNGTSTSARHNAFEVRQNGDIYLSSGGTDIKLQDHLGGGGSSYTAGDGIDITNDVISVTGKADTSAVTSVSDSLTAHTANTTVHVTAADKTAWNAKSDFSGSYNDLSNKPTIPTSASQLTNDSGYITSSALDGYATEAYVTAATNDMATKTWVSQQGYLTQHQDISGKQDVSGMTAYTTTATTNTLSGTVTAHTADTTIHVTAQDKTNWNNKSDFSGDYNDLSNKLSAGTNITIVDNVISAEGGGGKAVTGGTNISITTGETADTINCTLNLENGTNSQSGGLKLKSFVAGNVVSGRDACAFGGANEANGVNSFVTGFYNTGNTSNAFVSGSRNKTTNGNETLFGLWALSNGSRTGDANGYSDATLLAVGNGEWRSQTRHNAFEIRQNGDIYIANTDDTSTTNWYQKPMVRLQDTITATAANTTALGGLKLVKLSQSEYDALATKDSNTLYVING